MKTITVTNILTSALAMYSKFYDCTKFNYHQVAGEKLINDQNFQTFCLDTVIVMNRVANSPAPESISDMSKVVISTSVGLVWLRDESFSPKL